jgi:hypothetical protein
LLIGAAALIVPVTAQAFTSSSGDRLGRLIAHECTVIEMRIVRSDGGPYLQMAIDWNCASIRMVADARLRMDGVELPERAARIENLARAVLAVPVILDGLDEDFEICLQLDGEVEYMGLQRPFSLLDCRDFSFPSASRDLRIELRERLEPPGN